MLDNSFNPFEDTQKGTLLYHYTTIRNAVSILKSRSLRFGEIVRLNDLNESQRLIFSKNITRCDIWREAINSYVQISLTCDDPKTVIDPKRGFDLLTMWGHYAEGGYGVCLVLNKDRIIHMSELETYKNDYVQYYRYPDFDSSICFDSDNLEEEIDGRISDVYFIKSEEWIQEQEYRIVKKRGLGPESLDISGCIEGIILTEVTTELDGFKKNRKRSRRRRIKQLFELCREIPIYRYCHCSLNGARILSTYQDRRILWTSEGENCLLSGGRLDISFLDDKVNQITNTSR